MVLPRGPAQDGHSASPERWSITGFKPYVGVGISQLWSAAYM